MAYPRSGRRLSNSVVLLVLAALAVTVSGAGADYNLVLNPGFESPHQADTSFPYMGYGQLHPDNWTGGDRREMFMSHANGGWWAPHSGAQSLGLNGTYGPGWISQNLATVAGGTYDLSFFMAGDFEKGGTARTLEVFWGVGHSLGTVTFTRPSDWSHSSMGWALQSGGILSGLTATGPSTELKFVSLEPGEYDHGPALDDVRVIATPEPGSLSLLLLGLPGLVWLRRRRRA